MIIYHYHIEPQFLTTTRNLTYMIVVTKCVVLVLLIFFFLTSTFGGPCVSVEI